MYQVFDDLRGVFHNVDADHIEVDEKGYLFMRNKGCLIAAFAPRGWFAFVKLEDEGSTNVSSI